MPHASRPRPITDFHRSGEVESREPGRERAVQLRCKRIVRPIFGLILRARGILGLAALSWITTGTSPPFPCSGSAMLGPGCSRRRIEVHAYVRMRASMHAEWGGVHRQHSGVRQLQCVDARFAVRAAHIRCSIAPLLARARPPRMRARRVAFGQTRRPPHATACFGRGRKAGQDPWTWS